MNEFLPFELSTDAKRLKALETYHILDTPREQYFDDMVEIAANVCRTEIAVINFIGEDRQWFKAETGIGQRELPLDVSICRHAILEKDMLVIPDLKLDNRFTCNPLILQNNGLRFYAGALIKTPDGTPIGTVCVLDRNPRPEGLSVNQRQVLQSLARQVVSEIELRLSKKQLQLENQRLKESEDRLQLGIQIADFGLGTIDYRKSTFVLNDQAAKLFGLPPHLPISRSDVHARFHPEDIEWLEQEIDKLFEAKSSHVFNVEHRVLHPDGTVLWLLARKQIFYDLNELGESVPVSGTLAVRDITYRKKNEDEKNLLVRELHHRVGNLFSIAAGIVNMSARTAMNTDELARSINGRLHALSASHNLVHAYSANDADLLQKAQLSSVISTILQPYTCMECNVVEITGDDLLLDQETLSAISLAFHELGTNAMKYGAFSTLEGSVKVSWNMIENVLKLNWQEKGGPRISGKPSSKGFGTKLTEMLIEQQLKGSVQRKWDPDGLSVEIFIPIKSEHTPI